MFGGGVGRNSLLMEPFAILAFSLMLVCLPFPLCPSTNLWFLFISPVPHFQKWMWFLVGQGKAARGIPVTVGFSLVLLGPSFKRHRCRGGWSGKSQHQRPQFSWKPLPTVWSPQMSVSVVSCPACFPGSLHVCGWGHWAGYELFKDTAFPTAPLGFLGPCVSSCFYLSCLLGSYLNETGEALALLPSRRGHLLAEVTLALGSDCESDSDRTLGTFGTLVVFTCKGGLSCLPGACLGHSVRISCKDLLQCINV